MSLPPIVKQSRLRICRLCPTPCDMAVVDNPEAGCPIKSWPPYKPTGLGDVLETAFSPIAGALGVQNCLGCKSRKALANQLVPDIRRPWKLGPRKPTR